MNKCWRKSKAQSLMDNPETRATFGTRYRTKTDKEKSTLYTTKEMSNTYLIKKVGGHRCPRRIC